MSTSLPPEGPQPKSDVVLRAEQKEKLLMVRERIL